VLKPLKDISNLSTAVFTRRNPVDGNTPAAPAGDSDPSGPPFITSYYMRSQLPCEQHTQILACNTSISPSGYYCRKQGGACKQTEFAAPE